MTDATELDEAAVRAAVEGADARQWTEEWWRCHADGYFRAAMGAVPELGAYFAAITPTNMRLLLDEVTRLRAALDEARAEVERWKDDFGQSTEATCKALDRAEFAEAKSKFLRDRADVLLRLLADGPGRPRFLRVPTDRVLPNDEGLNVGADHVDVEIVVDPGLGGLGEYERRGYGPDVIRLREWNEQVLLHELLHLALSRSAWWDDPQRILSDPNGHDLIARVEVALWETGWRRIAAEPAALDRADAAERESGEAQAGRDEAWGRAAHVVDLLDTEKARAEAAETERDDLKRQYAAGFREWQQERARALAAESALAAGRALARSWSGRHDLLMTGDGAAHDIEAALAAPTTTERS